MRVSGVIVGLLCSVANAQSCLDPWILGNVFPHSTTGIGSAVGWDPDGAGPLEERLVISDFGSIPAAPDCDKVAWWDGKAWQPMGHPASTPRPLAVIAGELYGGDMRWNGSSWEALGDGLSDVLALGDWNGVPVAAARAAWNSLLISIFKWNGTAWEEIGATDAVTAPGGPRIALTTFGGELIAVGTWTTIDGQSIRSVARFDGATWSALGAGLASGNAQCASVIGGALCIGGNFTLANPTTTCSVAKWDGSAWTKYGPTGILPIGLADRAGTPIVLAPSCSDGCSTNADSVFQLQAGQWTAPATDGPKGDVRALATVGGSIVAVGQFACASAGPMLGARCDVAALGESNWKALTAGLNGSVGAALKSGTDLIVAGGFTQAAGVTASRIARWDGETWAPLGAGLNGAVGALAEFNGQLHAGGAFTKSGNTNVLYLSVWNGSAWQPVGNSGFDGSVTYLAASTDRLFAAGSFSHAGGLLVNGMAQLVDGKWYSIAGRSSGGGKIVVHQGALHVVGPVATTAGTMNGVAKWDGVSWSSLAPQFSGTIYDIFSDGDALWIQGSFKLTPSDPTRVIARWDGLSWQSFSIGAFRGRFVEHEGNLYLADNTTLFGFDGASWSLVSNRPGSTGSDQVQAAVSFGGEIVVGGSMQSTILSTLIFDPIFDRWTFDGVPSFLVQPQPASIGLGQVASMTVKIAGGYENFGGAHLRWRKNAVPLSDGPTPSGSFLIGTDSPTLLVNFSGGADSGFYDCVVSTDCGERTSQTARLLVGPPCGADFNNDGFVDDADFTIFVAAYDILECAAPEMPVGCPADLNGDGFVEDEDFSLFVVKYDELICP